MKCVWNTKGSKIHQHPTLYLSKQQSTQTGCYTIAAGFPFEPLEKCMTFKDIFPEISRTKAVFQGLTRSCNFQGKIQDFPLQEAWKPWQCCSKKWIMTFSTHSSLQIIPKNHYHHHMWVGRCQYCVSANHLRPHPGGKSPIFSAFLSHLPMNLTFLYLCSL